LDKSVHLKAPWTRAFTSKLLGQEPSPQLARSTIQAWACRQLPSPKLTKKTPFSGRGSRNAAEDSRTNILQLNTEGLTAKRPSSLSS